MLERLTNLFHKLPKTGGGKDHMGDTTPTANPPAASGGIDLKTFTDMLGAAVKPLAEAIAEIKAATAKTPSAPGQDRPLTAADVQKLLADALKAHSATTEQTTAREKFLGEKLADLPAAYRGQLGTDPAKWAGEEQAIRTQYQADFKAAGGKTPDVAGGAAGGEKVASAVDTSKLSGFELLNIGLAKLPVPGAVAVATETQKK
jgi:hypothetical protein